MAAISVQCLICDSRVANSARNVVEIFGVTASLHSSKSFPEVVGEIINKTVNQNAHSKVLCKKCYKSCLEYDEIQARLAEIRSDLTTQFKTTLPKHNLSYDNYPEKMIQVTPEKSQSKSVLKKLVVPASKLKPLPSNYVIVNQLGRKITVNNTPPSHPELKLTPTSSPTKIIPPPSISQTNTTESAPIITLDATLNDQSVASILNSTSGLTFDVKQFLDGASILKGNEREDCDNHADNAMEIDEECTYSTINQDAHEPDIESVLKENSCKPDTQVEQQNMFDLSLLPQTDESPTDNGSNDTDKYVIRKVEIVDRNSLEDEDHTILMESEDGSLIRVVSGGQLLYGDNEISLIMPESNNGDSNDESQIELQMSGDEETANAIIEATRNEGGTFIKVGSGETYQVKSVESRVEQHVDVLKSIVDRDGDTYVCVICSNRADNSDSNNTEYTTKDSAAMLQHIKTQHGTRIYICAVCGDVLRKKSEYTKHLEAHGHNHNTPNKKYTCDICLKKCGSKSLLVEHMNVHSGSRPYVCKICDKSFASKYTHSAHLKIHLDRPRLFKCNVCEKSFYTQQNLQQHEKTHLTTREFICKVCGKGFVSQHNLEVHGVVHSGVKSFVCGICGKSFARKAEIQDHMRTHTGERPFQCDTCGASFSQRSNLQSHRRATHLRVLPHACTACDRRFKRRRLLDYHIKACHTGERPHQCEICRASFVYPEHYKKHMRIHTGEKPYECEVCGKTFNSRDNRNTHRFVHSDKKPYECLVCTAGFMRKMQLYAHMNSCGHMAESIVVNQPRLSTADDEDSQGEPTIKIKSSGEASTETTNEIKVETDSASLLKLFVDETKSNSGENAKIFITSEDNDNNTEHLMTDTETGSIITTEGHMININDNQIMTAESESGMVRLVQIKLPNGTDGWIAIN